MIKDYKIGTKTYSLKELKEKLENKLIEKGLVLHEYSFNETIEHLDEAEYLDNLDDLFDFYYINLESSHEHEFDTLTEEEFYPIMTSHGPDMHEGEHKIDVCQYCGYIREYVGDDYGE